jgi:hypothetical protein
MSFPYFTPALWVLGRKGIVKSPFSPEWLIEDVGGYDG